MLEKRLDDVQYHYNQHHDILFLTAVDPMRGKSSVSDGVEMHASRGEMTASECRQSTSELCTPPCLAESSTCDASENPVPQTKIYVPHIAAVDLNMWKLCQIQRDLFDWSQQNLAKPPDDKHVVLAIVDPSYTIVYYKMTNDFVDL